MNNYEYIVASLPVISAGYRGELDCDGILEQIREQLSGRDLKSFQTLLDGFDGENLCPEFYVNALQSRERFIREYFSWDLDLRNCKVEFLNKALGRPEGMDIMSISEEPREFERKEEVMAALEVPDLLKRERNLDDLMWEKIDQITGMDVFSINVILGFVAKLQIIARWLKLDEQTGRALFAQLVDEIRNNKKPIE